MVYQQSGIWPVDVTIDQSTISSVRMRFAAVVLIIPASIYM